jgi:hypothetical protein
MTRAERRERRKLNGRKMRVSGNSVKLISRLMENRARRLQALR